MGKQNLLKHYLMPDELYEAWIPWTKKATKLKHYSLFNILQRQALYNMVFGERSNGKSYSVLELMVIAKAVCGWQGGVVRRYAIDFVGKRGAAVFENINKNDGFVEKVTGGKWTSIKYKSKAWYFVKYDDKLCQYIFDAEPLAYAFSLAEYEHDKSTGYPNVNIILFDEFITRNGYLTDEFILFMNVVSTIVRSSVKTLVFMCANTVNKYCPYFEEMGLYNVKKMKTGDIDLYKFGENGKLTVAVERTEPNVQGKKSDVYFAFNNPKLKMITNGEWEIDIYPHCPIERIDKGNTVFTYFIEFNTELLQCDIVVDDKDIFTYIHRKTTPLRKPDTDLIYSTRYDSRINWNRLINRPTSKIGKRVWWFFQTDRVYYATNEVGEVVRNYLIECGTDVS